MVKNILAFAIVIEFSSFNEITKNYHTVSVSDLMSPRILGGWNVQDGDIPYQVMLRMPDDLCGGAFIKVEEKQAVLTAAHCVPASQKIDDITLVAGNVQLRGTSTHEQTRKVQQIIRYSYNGRTREVDLAILQLDRPFEENEYVKPIPLPTRNKATTGNVVVSGWGYTSSAKRPSEILKSLTVRVTSQTYCQLAYGLTGTRIYNSMMCAGGGGRGTCGGDSGGPARAENGNYLAGIVSWGKVSGLSQVSYVTNLQKIEGNI